MERQEGETSLPRTYFRPTEHHSRIVFLTGAGLSVAAGLSTFRGPDGLWALAPELEAAMYAERLPGSLPQLWHVWAGMRRRAHAAGPTAGHRAIAAMGAPVITQNVENLHQDAGSDEVIELHGTAARAVCLNPRCGWSMEVAGEGPGDGSTAQDFGVPNLCPLCSAPTRPDVVLFGEMLPEEAMLTAMRRARTCDLFVSVGTSGTVAPASLLAPLARDNGAETVCIDPAADSGAEAIFDHVIRHDAQQVLPSWVGITRRRSRNPFLDPFD